MGSLFNLFGSFRGGNTFTEDDATRHITVADFASLLENLGLLIAGDGYFVAVFSRLRSTVFSLRVQPGL
jgi:hypothetical protein